MMRLLNVMAVMIWAIFGNAAIAQKTTELSPTQQLSAFEADCEKGDNAACNNAGAQTLEDELEQLIIKCDAGVVAACSIGLARNDDVINNMSAQDRVKDDFKAVNEAQLNTLQLSMAGCIRDDGYSCYRAAFTNLHGIGDADIGDFDSTIKALNKSCKLGSVDGCAALAGVLWTSEDPEDLKRARELSASSCAGQSANGCGIFGHLLQYGKGGRRDFDLAAAISRYACDNGHNGGCGDLAQLYLGGYGVPESKGMAIVYFDKQCNLAFGRAGCKERDDLRAEEAKSE